MYLDHHSQAILTHLFPPYVLPALAFLFLFLAKILLLNIARTHPLLPLFSVLAASAAELQSDHRILAPQPNRAFGALDLENPHREFGVQDSVTVSSPESRY